MFKPSKRYQVLIWNDFNVFLSFRNINKCIQKIFWDYWMHFSSVGCVKGEQKKTSYTHFCCVPPNHSSLCIVYEHMGYILPFFELVLWTWLFYFFIILEVFILAQYCVCVTIFHAQPIIHNRLEKIKYLRQK